MNSLRSAFSAGTKLLLMLSLMLAGAVGPAGAQEADTIEVATLAPVEIRAFELVAGRPQWAQSTRDRLGRTIFQFGPSGQFAMVQPDGYPMLIGVVGDDGSITASTASAVGSAGSTTVEMYGQLSREGEVPVLEIRYVSGAALAAVVNGTSFGSSTVKAFTATVALRQL